MPPPEMERARLGSGLTGDMGSPTQSTAPLSVYGSPRTSEQIGDTQIVYAFLAERMRLLLQHDITAWAEQLGSADLADLDRTIRKLQRLRSALAARLGES